MPGVLMTLELRDPFPDASPSLLAPFSLEELENAVRNQELLLHFQPKLSCRNGRIVGLEALLRWQHPRHGLILPSHFVPLLESSGKIVEVGEWILGAACQQLGEWRASGVPTVPVAVNLSVAQIMADGFYDSVSSLIEKAGLPPELLELELTESMLMADVEKAISVMQRLSALGVSLSVDDFGTGYSSLSYLKRFPLSALKVDRSFVSDITADTNDVSITRAIITMAHALKLRVIAEGVETAGQMKMLIANHCDEVQGFVFSGALSADEIAYLLKGGKCLPAELLNEGRPRRRLLLVDDEENILSALKRLLRTEGYEILTATTGEAGLEILAKHEVDVIVSDQRMPGMTGTEFLRRAKELHPDTVRMVLSGYAELEAITSAINDGAIYKFLSKPWEAEQLCAHIAGAFDFKEMADENRRLNEGIVVANSELSKANRRLQTLLEETRGKTRMGEAALMTLQQITRATPVAMLGIDSNCMVVWTNERADRLFADGALLGRQVETIFPELLLTSTDRQPVRIGECSYNVISCVLESAHASQSFLLTLLPSEVPND